MHLKPPLSKVLAGEIELSAEALFSFLCSNREQEASDRLLELLKGSRFEALTLERDNQALSLRRWLNRADWFPAAALFIRFYNENFARADAIMEAFLRDKNDLLPYPDLTIMMLLSLRMGRTNEVNEALRADRFEQWIPLVKDFVSDESMPEFIRNLRLDLRYYGGRTHTVLGLYDNYLNKLMDCFNPEAEFLGDLGGGYATADLNRATKLNFTSVDILSPDIRKGDPDYLPLRKKVNPWAHLFLNGEERAEYIEKQSKVGWRPWNVLEDRPFVDILGDYNSYGFVSCGFLTSLVRPYEKEFIISNERSNSLSQRSCLRLMELVAAGKDVSLITVERASSVIRDYKAVAFRWHKGELIAFKGLKNDRAIYNTYHVSGPRNMTNPELELN